MKEIRAKVAMVSSQFGFNVWSGVGSPGVDGATKEGGSFSPT